jgi:predicted amidohydrolase YtcJ
VEALAVRGDRILAVGNESDIMVLKGQTRSKTSKKRLHSGIGTPN